jgi:hypothetical protein
MTSNGTENRNKESAVWSGASITPPAPGADLGGGGIGLFSVAEGGLQILVAQTLADCDQAHAVIDQFGGMGVTK